MDALFAAKLRAIAAECPPVRAAVTKADPDSPARTGPGEATDN
jgi:hypothetical protein